MRYPEAGLYLTTFVVETFGRLGGEARQWLLAQTRELPGDTIASELNRAYKVVSCAVQRELAVQLRKARGFR